MEQIDLDAPDQTRTGTGFYRVSLITYDVDSGRIIIVLRGDEGLERTFVYADGEALDGRPEPGGTRATDLMRAINKMDFRTKSQHRRIIERLVADGRLEGIISGTSD